MKSTITTKQPLGFAAGDVITFTEWKPWYVRLWRWITRYKPPVHTITNVSETVITITSGS